jgi:hypothetical protein
MDRRRSDARTSRANARRARTGQRASGSPKPPPPDLAELRQGRDHGELMLYDPNAAFNYQSEQVRYLKAVDLAPDAMRPETGGYRIASAGRSTAGYWTPGAVRVYCQCGGTPDPYGTILEFDIESGVHDLTLRTEQEVTLMLWRSAPDCDFAGADLVPVATLTPEAGVASLAISIAANPYYSFQVGDGYNLAFACVKVVNLEPQATILQLL